MTEGMEMKLNEDIQRIKQVMGINESVVNSFKRRIDELPEQIRISYTLLNPKAFENFNKFVIRVAFSTTRDMLDDIPGDNKEKMLYADEIEVFVKRYIDLNLSDELRDYYEKEVNK